MEGTLGQSQSWFMGGAQWHKNTQSKHQEWKSFKKKKKLANKYKTPSASSASEPRLLSTCLLPSLSRLSFSTSVSTVIILIQQSIETERVDITSIGRPEASDTRAPHNQYGRQIQYNTIQHVDRESLQCGSRLKPCCYLSFIGIVLYPCCFAWYGSETRVVDVSAESAGISTCNVVDSGAVPGMRIPEFRYLPTVYPCYNEPCYSESLAIT